MKHLFKPNKNITRAILVLVLLIILFSLILFLYSTSSGKKTSFDFSKTTGTYTNKGDRNFEIESEQEQLYNLGEYCVNLSEKKFLTLDISVKTSKPAYAMLVKNKVIIQSAVIDTFSTYGDITAPNSIKGHQLIKRRILKRLNKKLGEDVVEEVLFNKFLIQ